MAESTGIGWCDATFNPWIGCEKVSPGCAHCYAETLVHGRMGRGGTWGPDGVRERTSPSNWKKPLRWAKLARWGNLPNGTENPDGHRPRVFCASLADVFEERPELDPWRDELFELIAATPELDWLVLTKRPELAREFLFELDTASGLGGRWVSRDDPEPFGWGCPFNLWVGTSIENARHTYRADVLREIPAAVRFISAEPLLGSLFESKSRRQLVRDREASSEVVRMFIDEGAEPDDASRYVREVEASLVHRDKHPLDLHGIDWVIVGGESGPGARPMRVEWAREIRDACRYCGPAIFVKQLGKEPTERRHWRTIHDLPAYIDEPLELRHKKGEDWAEWPADLRIREFPRERDGARVKLTLAAGSLGYYRVDADGNVYVPRLYARPDSIEHRLGMSPDVGDRPDPKRHQQTAYGAVYWVPHGTREDLTDEQRAELEVVLA